MKLNQIIAVVGGKKTQTEKKMTEIYHKIQKPTLFEGISRTYHPLDEEGEMFPPETKNIQYSVSDSLEEAKKALVELLGAMTACCQIWLPGMSGSMSMSANRIK